MLKYNDAYIKYGSNVDFSVLRYFLGDYFSVSILSTYNFLHPYRFIESNIHCEASVI